MWLLHQSTVRNRNEHCVCDCFGLCALQPPFDIEFAHERDVAARIYSGPEKGHRRIGIKRSRGELAAVHPDVECGAVSTLAPAHAVRMEDTLGGYCGARGIDYVEELVLLRPAWSDPGAVMRHDIRPV